MDFFVLIVAFLNNKGGLYNIKGKRLIIKTNKYDDSRNERTQQEDQKDSEMEC